MSIVRVKFNDWHGEEHSVDVTSDMCAGVNTSVDEKMIICAIRYIKRNYKNCYGISSVEIIAK